MIVFLIIAVVVAIPLIMAAFLSDEFSIEREVVINRPLNEVFSFIKLIRNQEKYSKWNMTDPQKKTESVGTDGTVGFIYKWDSKDKNAGAGEQEITGVTEGKRLDCDLRFIRPFKNNAKTWIVTEAVSADQTRVKWGFGGHRSYVNKLMHFLLNLTKMLGNDMQTSLNNLKDLFEKPLQEQKASVK